MLSILKITHIKQVFSDISALGGGGHINEPYFGENRHYDLSFFFVLIVLYVENEGRKYVSKAEYPPSFKNERNIYKYKNIKTDKICLHSKL